MIKLSLLFILEIFDINILLWNYDLISLCVMCICISMCVDTCAGASGGQRLTAVVFPNASPSSILGKVSHMNPELTSSAGEVIQILLESCFCLPSCPPSLYLVLEIQSGPSSCLTGAFPIMA